MKLVIDNAIPFLEHRLPEEIETVFLPGKDITSDIVKNADALIIRTRTQCNKSLLEGSDVKLIATATIGTDHIDTEWCEKNGIKVCNAPGCNAPGVAQYVLASLFASGFDPKHHTLGIVGYGNVGHILTRWAEQCGVNVIVSDAPKQAQGNTEREYCNPEFLLKNSDAVSLHVPFCKDGEFPTYHLIDESQLKLMKPGSILVNSSRGGVVNESALKKAIKEKNIRAIIDVWENEPEIDPELVQLAYISTPHIAGYSEEGKKRATSMVLKAISDFAGIKTIYSDLECTIDITKPMSRPKIESSYDPVADSTNLKSDISQFEFLRNNYSYRKEPL